jgi:hypothetical protein
MVVSARDFLQIFAKLGDQFILNYFVVISLGIANSSASPRDISAWLALSFRQTDDFQISGLSD